MTTRNRGRLVSLGYHKKPLANRDGSRSEDYVEFELLMSDRAELFYRFRDSPNQIVAAETRVNNDTRVDAFTIPRRSAGQAFGDRYATSGRTDTIMRVDMPEPKAVWVDSRPEQSHPAFDSEQW